MDWIDQVAEANEMRARRRAGRRRWAVWGAVLVFTPALAMGAYQPDFILPNRSISTTAPLTGGGDLSANRTLGISDCNATTRGAVPTPPNNTTTYLRGDCTFAAPTAPAASAPTIYTGTLPVTLANTDGLLEVIEMASPASGVANLPPSPTAGVTVCIKDGLKNFASNILTVKTSDGATIDKVAGATGFPMNQNGQANCFRYASSGTNWYVL